MEPSKACEELVQSFEGLARQLPDGMIEAYPDPGTGGEPWTIGWGTTRGVHSGMVITRAEADTMFQEDLHAVGQQVAFLVKDTPLTQGQFDALVSFTYNVGRGAFAASTLLRLLLEGDYAGAAGQFERWVKGGNGQSLPGLVRRREAERKMFTGEA